MSLDLEAAAVVVSVEGCRCAGVCLQMLDCRAGALDVHSLFQTAVKTECNFDLWKRLMETNVSFTCYLGSMLASFYLIFLLQFYGGIHHSPLPGPNPWASGPRRL